MSEITKKILTRNFEARHLLSTKGKSNATLWLWRWLNVMVAWRNDSRWRGEGYVRDCITAGP